MHEKDKMFETVEETREALKKGEKVLAEAAAEEPDQDEMKKIEFCKGCLMELRDSLTHVEGTNVNSGCG